MGNVKAAGPGVLIVRVCVQSYFMCVSGVFTEMLCICALISRAVWEPNVCFVLTVEVEMTAAAVVAVVALTRYGFFSLIVENKQLV